MTDSGGLTDVQNLALTVTDRDEYAPVASPTTDPPPNAAGWNSTVMTIIWNWADDQGGSGLGGGGGAGSDRCTTGAGDTVISCER